MPGVGAAVTIALSDGRARLEELPMITEMPRRQREAPWASGFTVFVAALLVVGGMWHVFAGIAALVRDKVYLSTPSTCTRST